jgi:hypothetical protein
MCVGLAFRSWPLVRIFIWLTSRNDLWMSVNNRFSTIDRVILCGSVVILAVLSYLLYDDSLLFPSSKQHEKTIGTISSMNNDVRRKNSGNFVWLPGNSNDEVYEKDSIFTGDGSQAAIKLNDGTVIQISENSLVNLNQKNGEMELDLRFGQFVGNGTTVIKVKTGNEEYTIQGSGGKFEINRSKSGELDVKVISGSAEISGKAGKQNLKSNESLQITKKGTEKSEVEAKIRLITKDDVILYRYSDKVPLNFEWDGKGPISQYSIEVSKTEDFKKVLVLHSTKEEKIALKEIFKEGVYFWRVKALDISQKLLVTSSIQKFNINLLVAPKIVTPEDKATFKSIILPNKPDGLKMTAKVTWDGEARHALYHWQLSSTEDFTNIVVEKTFNEKQFTTQPLNSGTYFTRVRGFDKEKHPSPWSKVTSFKLEVEGEVKPPAPRLAEKYIRFQMPKLEGRAPSAETSPQMAWSQVLVAKDYHWEIAKNKAFTGAQVQDTESTKIAWTQYKPGKYYYRVFTRSQLGQSSNPSETGVLEVYTDAPVLNPIPTILVKETNLNAVAPAKEVRAAWSKIPDANAYILQVDKDKNFTNPTEQIVNDSESMIKMPEPGKYFLRVKAMNEANQEMSEFSNIQDANYIFRKTLKAPQLIEPYDKTTLFLQKDMEPLIWLEWSSVPDATKYLLEASTKADFSRIVMSKTMTETRFLVREKIPYGNIYWRVRAIGIEESLNSDWAQREFMIFHQKNSGF